MRDDKFLGWAYKLAEREMNREQLPSISNRFWREALGIDKKTSAVEALKILRIGEAA